MVRPSALLAAGALAAFAVSAFAQPAAPVDVRAAMQQQVNPAMLAIWDVGNNAMNDEGGLDPAKLDDVKWMRVAEAAEQLAAAGHAMAAGQGFLAAAPGNAAVGEGEVAMSEVQKHLDADPAGFRVAATAFAEHAERIAAAARTKDAASAGDLIAATDAVCESCHSRFWYPE